MAGPLAVLAAGFVTMWIAFSGADALVVDDYYKQGKAINQDLRRDHQAASLGLQFGLRYDAADGKLIGQLKGDSTSAPLKLMLIHPTMQQKDATYVVLPDHEGKFSVTLPLLERAHWQVLLEDEARTWRLQGLWNWPQQITIDIHPKLGAGQEVAEGAGKPVSERGK